MPVGLVGIHPLRLKRIGFDLVAEADSPTFLAQIENNPAFVLGNEFQRSVKLLATIALEAPKDFAGEALGMNPDWHSFAPAHIPEDHRMKSSPLGG